MTTFSIQHDRIVRGRTDHDHLMMHGCGAGIDHRLRVAKRPIKIRNEKRTKRIYWDITRCTWAWTNRQEWRRADRMIVAYSRGDGAATNYEIAWVTVALQHLRVGDDSWARMDLGAPGRAPAAVDRRDPAGAARLRGLPGLPARLGELSLASGHGAVVRPLSEH